jgi:hypothetical protein
MVRCSLAIGMPTKTSVPPLLTTVPFAGVLPPKPRASTPAAMSRPSLMTTVPVYVLDGPVTVQSPGPILTMPPLPVTLPLIFPSPVCASSVRVIALPEQPAAVVPIQTTGAPWTAARPLAGREAPGYVSAG